MKAKKFQVLRSGAVVLGTAMAGITAGELVHKWLQHVSPNHPMQSILVGLAAGTVMAFSASWLDGLFDRQRTK